jgi:hypothetical protein
MTTFPVLTDTSPTNVGVVIEGLVEKTKFVLVVPVAPVAV